MANIIVTSSTNAIKADFGVLGVSPLPKKGTWNKAQVISFTLSPSDAFLKASILGENEWQLSWNGTNGLQVDSIDGVAPTSNSDLYDKLLALLG